MVTFLNSVYTSTLPSLSSYWYIHLSGHNNILPRLINQMYTEMSKIFRILLITNKSIFPLSGEELDINIELCELDCLYCSHFLTYECVTFFKPKTSKINL